jgi:hypothetical protein
VVGQCDVAVVHPPYLLESLPDFVR